MLRIFDVMLTSRAVLFQDGIPSKALGPGRHWEWGFGLSVRYFDTDHLIFEARPRCARYCPRVGSTR